MYRCRTSPSQKLLDLIGERWALIVVRELVLGPKRFAAPCPEAAPALSRAAYEAVSLSGANDGTTKGAR